MSSTKPTVLLVHGAWHGPIHYKPFTDMLETAGFPTCCPSQPTWGGPPSLTVEEDAATIRSALQTLVEEQSKDVIVLMHSYGGHVGSQAVDESLGKKTRSAKGLRGGVVHLVYMSAFVLSVGESLAAAWVEASPPSTTVADDGRFQHPQEAETLFYHDLPVSEQKHWASELKTHSLAAQLTPSTYAAWKHYPVSYLYCTDDRTIPIVVQRGMVARSGGKFRSFSCDAGHSPFLSQPESVLEVIRKVAE